MRRMTDYFSTCHNIAVVESFKTASGVFFAGEEYQVNCPLKV